MKRSSSFKTSKKKFEEANFDFEDAHKTEVKEEESEDMVETPDNTQPESELLPGPKGQPLYYDGVGYYYNETSEEESFRLLHCSHSGCGAQAQMDLTPGAPIILLPTSEGHAHEPNIARRERIRFLHRIKTRRNSEDLPFHTIFQEEAKINPLGASFFSFEKIEKHLKKKASETEETSQTTPYKEQSPLIRTKRSVMQTKLKGISDHPTAKKRKLDDTLKSPLPNKLELLKINFQNIGHSNSDPRESNRLDCGPSEPEQSEQNIEASNKRTTRVSKRGFKQTSSPNVKEERQKNCSFSDISCLSNNDFQESEKRNSAKILGPEFFHNFKGYYYYSAGVKNGKRYLRCLVPTCLAEAFMNMEDNAEICPLANSRPHNHKPDLTTNYSDKIKQIESCWSESLPSERLPSFGQQYCCYHDRKGFYYHQSSQKDNIRYLVCIESSCSARAHMCTQKDSPITVSPLRPPHNHKEDPSLRDALLFIDAARVRVRSGVDPYVSIEQEKERNLIGANRIDLKILELCLKKMSEIGSGGFSNEDMVDFGSSVKSAKSIQANSNAVPPTIVQNHFDTVLPILDLPEPESQDENCKKAQQEAFMTKKEQSERVPGLLPNTWLYHDCNGYYYTSKGISQDKRILQCTVPKCKIKGWMCLEPQAPIHTLQVHNHDRQPSQHRTELWFYHKIKVRILERWNESVAQVYSSVAAMDPEGAALISEEDVQDLVDKLCPDRGRRAVNMVHQTGKLPSERLPGPVFCNLFQYHDGQGFYYYKDKKVQNSNMWYLRCVCTTCPGKAIMACKEGAPITVKYRHSHEPDLLHHKICLFTHALKKRTRDESTPLRAIYSEEASKYPDAAAVMRENEVKGELLRIRRYVKCQMGIAAEGDDEDDTELLPTQAPSKVSEVLQNTLKPVYLDGRGYYFIESFSTDSLRYLACMESQCLAQAKMLLVPGAPVVPQVGAAPHNHAADPLHCVLLKLLDTLRYKARSQRSKKIKDIYQETIVKEPIVAPQISKERLLRMLENIRKSEEMENSTSELEKDNQIEEESLLVSDVPAERIPSYEHQGWLYHDGRGYYYYCQHTDKDVKSRRLLKCCDCNASAWLEMKPQAAIQLAAGSVLHNHTPDTQRRELLLILHRIATRMSSEALPYATILLEESKRYPEVLPLISKEKIKDMLQKETVSKYFKEDVEIEEECIPEETSNDIDDNQYCSSTCETLQSTTSGQPVYSDGRGFYYRDHCRTSCKLHLVCTWPLCKARAFFLQDTSKIFVPKEPSEHNHEPDAFYRNKLIFVNNLRQRVLSEVTPINTIYIEEANREPIGADMVNDVSIKNFMYKLCKSKNIENSINDVDLDLFEDFEEAEYTTSTALKQLVKEAVANLPSSNNDLEDSADDFDDTTVIKHSEPQPEAPQTINYLKKRPVQPVQKSKGRSLSEYTPSERLPSRSINKLFHDGKGYYYRCNVQKDNIMYLRCAENCCKVRAWKYLDTDDSPILHSKSSPEHNHQPNFDKRNRLLLLHRCKIRAATENIPINDIWLMESARDPETAKQLSSENVKTQLKRYRQEQMALQTEMDSSLAQNEESDGSNSAQMNEQKGVIPEKVPSLINETLWHAAGFFYLPYSSTYIGHSEIIKCKCVNKGCSAHCHITAKPGGSPSICLNLSTHNHPADHRRKDQLLFINRCKRSATESLESVDNIYNEEAAKYPQVAKQLSASRVKQAMIIAKKAHQKKFDSSLKSGNYEDDLEDDLESISEINELNSSKEDKNKEQPGVPTKHFQSEELGAMIFHDDSGFFYQDIMKSKIENTRLLKCVECEVAVTTCLEPLDSCLLPLDHATRHTHPPGLEITIQEDNTVKLQKTCKTAKLIGPKFLKTSQVEEEIDSQQNISESENCSDPEYSDLVTLEEEIDNPNDEEVSDSGSDPDFNASQRKILESKRQFHDGNGYYFTLVRDKKKRWLKCQTAKCPVKVPLESKEKPVMKLFKVSPSHPHLPDQLRSKRNLFLKQSALQSTSLSGKSEPEEEDCGSPKTDIILRKKDKEDSVKLGKSVEMVHGLRPNTFNYHDGKGFYYNAHVLTDNYRYFRCVKSSCKARAFMSLQPLGPIKSTRQSPGHNHLPDLAYKTFTYFLDQCKIRALKEETPIKQIYEEETAKDPVSAAKISKDNLIQRMVRTRNGLTGTKSMTSVEENQFDYIAKSENTVKDVLSTLDQEIEDDRGNEDQVEFEKACISKDLSSVDAPSDLINEDYYQEDNNHIHAQNEDTEEALLAQSDDTEKTDKVYLYQPTESVIPQRPTFCDDKGFCYQQTTLRQGVRYLKCTEKDCKVKASMDVEQPNAAIVLSKQTPSHNHQPDQSDYTMLLESGQLVGSGNKSFQLIYTDSDGGEQVAVCHIREEGSLPKQTCRQRNIPELTINTEEPVNTSTTEVDEAAGDYYHNEDQQQYPLKPAEVIPGLRPDANNYHDGNGFYYELNRVSHNIRYFKCLTKNCRARAYMEIGKKNAPIIQTNFAKHNHGPDLFRKQFTVFLHRMTRRAAEEDTPINVIYQEEAARDPESASQIRMENVKQRMIRYRKKHRPTKVLSYEDLSGTDADLDGAIFRYLVEENKGIPDDSIVEDYHETEIQTKDTIEQDLFPNQEEDIDMDESSLYETFVVNEVEVESSTQEH